MSAKSISKQSGNFLSFDGTRIYYETRGQGIPLVFCYGIGCLMNHWRHQLKYFSKDFQTISFDYRAHHKSGFPKDKSDLTVRSLAQDLKSLIDHLRLKDPVLLGHSFGTQVILSFLSEYPEVAKSFVSINGFATNPLKGMFGNSTAETVFDLMRKGNDLLPQTMSALWKIGVHNPFSMHLSALLGGFNIRLTQFKDIEIYAKGLRSLELSYFIPLFEDMLRFDGTEHLDKIKIPTLILGGDKDGITPVSKQEHLHRRIKGSELQIVPYGSHCTQLDFPDFVNLRIEKFLTGTT